MGNIPKIGLDAGHGLKTAGKQTPDGIKEWELNNKVRDKVVDILQDYEVEIVHTDNKEGNVDEGLSTRRNMYVNQEVKAFVSIHHNAFTSNWNNATGVEVYTDKNPTTADQRLADCVYGRLVHYTDLKGRGIKQSNFTVINQNKIPAILVEGGFMDSTNDHKIITSDEGQTAYAKAVAEGLVEFLGLQKKTTVSVPTPTPTVSKPVTITSTTRNYLMKGDKGAEVKTMQENLIYMGYSCGKAGADGDFGGGTDSAVRAFQKDNCLTVDGKYGAKSKAKLEELIANKKKASENQGNPIVKVGQQHAINFTGVKIDVDGIVGKDTNKMKARVLQHAMNLDYGNTIAEDGDFQTKSKAKLGNHYVKKGESQYMVTAAEILMMLHGIDPNGVECPGKYGNGLVKAAKKFFGDDGTKITASEFLRLIQ